jgi:uracil-DNA glycosylase family 4
MIASPIQLKQYDRHVNAWKGCVKCEIGEWAKHHVFMRGTIPCDVLLIGEGPGKTEDQQGFPFIGPSGILLDEWLEPYHGKLKFAITNTVLCRPTNYKSGANRAPSFTEVRNCQPRLAEFIALSKPKAMILIGRIAKESVLGNWITIPKVSVYHPAYVLRNGGRGIPMERDIRSKIAAFLEGICRAM